MYCRECGKEINYQAEICHECAAKRAQAATTPAVQPTTNNIMLGFGKALTGAILGVVSCLLYCLAFMLTVIATQPGQAYFGVNITPAPALICVIVSIALTIICLVTGVSSIKTFNRVKNSGGKKPIPAFVIGISNVVLSVFNFIFIMFFTFTIIVILTAM